MKALAVPVMAHRVILRGLYGKAGENEAFIRELLDKAGMTLEAVYDAYTEDDPRPDSERLTFIAREKTKRAAGQDGRE